MSEIHNAYATAAISKYPVKYVPDFIKLLEKSIDIPYLSEPKSQYCLDYITIFGNQEQQTASYLFYMKAINERIKYYSGRKNYEYIGLNPENISCKDSSVQSIILNFISITKRLEESKLKDADEDSSRLQQHYISILNNFFEDEQAFKELKIAAKLYLEKEDPAMLSNLDQQHINNLNYTGETDLEKIINADEIRQNTSAISYERKEIKAEKNSQDYLEKKIKLYKTRKIHILYAVPVAVITNGLINIFYNDINLFENIFIESGIILSVCMYNLLKQNKYQDELQELNFKNQSIAVAKTAKSKNSSQYK